MNTKKANSVKISGILLKYSAFLMLIVLIIVATILSPVFLSVGNVFNVLRQQTPHALVALGVLLTILTGGIDLSPGAVLAVANVIIAVTVRDWGLATSGGIWIAMLLAVFVGLVFGMLNGILVSKFKLAPFIATLATMTMARGCAYMITGGSPVRLPINEDGSKAFIDFGQSGDPLIGVPLSVWFVIAVIVIFWFFMKYTSFGRMIVASGSNETALRFAGINVDRYKFSVYVISGIMASLAGILLASRAAMGTPASGQSFEMDAIAGCVIGGASLSGGKGTVINTIIGVMVIALIGNIMNLLSIAAYPQQIIQGAIIILAVLMNKGEKEE
jgi:ribose transport system permease protein